LVAPDTVTPRQHRGSRQYRTFAWGGYLIDELYRQQDVETVQQAQAILHQIQQLMHERVMFAPIFVFVGRAASGHGWRIGLVDRPYPWAAP
jgi:hypothetical protein